MLNIVEEAKDFQNEIIEMRRELHKIPEIGLNLPKTSLYVENKLKEMGIDYSRNKGDSGIVGIIEGENPGKVVALRADMDALPIKEENKVNYASLNGNMHACGHDAHTAMLLAAAKILNSNKENFSGIIKLIFQTDEENAGGAKVMVKEGVLDNPKVDYLLGLHIGAIFPILKPGQIGVSYGKTMASFDKFIIKIMGKGCHGATPHLGVDPIVVAGQIITALQSVISRNLNPNLPGVLTIGKLNGGEAYNIIPEEVKFEGTIRAVDKDQRKMMIERIEEIVDGITKASKANYEFEIYLGAPPVINDENIAKEFVKSASQVIEEDNIIELKEPSLGGEDVAIYLDKIPGAFFFLGSNNEEKGIVYPHHNSKFNVDEDVLWEGTALLVNGAINLLYN